MADKKKNANQSATRSRNQMAELKARKQEQAVEPKVSGDAKEQGKNAKVVEPKVSGDEKEQGKNVKAVARVREERKVQESKTVRRDNRGSSSSKKAPATWQIRLRGNRFVRFVLDAYYELRHKVTWPSFNEARNMTIVVILLSGAVALVLGVADFGLQNLYVLIIHLGGK